MILHRLFPHRVVLLLATALLLSGSLKAQEESVYTLPSLTTDVTSQAIGGGVSLSTQMPIYTLPTASLLREERFHAAYSVVGIPLSVTGTDQMIHTLAAGYRIRDGIDISLGGRYLRSRQVDVVDEMGRVAGHFTPIDASLDLALALALRSHLAGYLRASYLQSYVGVTGRTGAVSLGLTYHDTFVVGDGIALKGCLSALLDHVGFPMTYRGMVEDGSSDRVRGKVQLPSTIALDGHLSTTLAEEHTLNLSLRSGLYYHLHPSRGFYAGIGGEYQWRDMLSLRVGLHQLGCVTSYGVGAGVEYWGVSLQTVYSYMPSLSAGNLSLGLSFRM